MKYCSGCQRDKQEAEFSGDKFCINCMKLLRFLNALDDNGDVFLTSGDRDYDLKGVEAIIDHQGYWAGGAVRYYFDEDLNLLRTEERRFGS